MFAGALTASYRWTNPTAELADRHAAWAPWRQSVEEGDHLLSPGMTIKVLPGSGRLLSSASRRLDVSTATKFGTEAPALDARARYAPRHWAPAATGGRAWVPQRGMRADLNVDATADTLFTSRWGCEYDVEPATTRQKSGHHLARIQ